MQAGPIKHVSSAQQQQQQGQQRGPNALGLGLEGWRDAAVLEERFAEDVAARMQVRGVAIKWAANNCYDGVTCMHTVLQL